MPVSGCLWGTWREAPRPQQSTTEVADPSEGCWQTGPVRPPQYLGGRVSSQKGAGSSLPRCTKLEAFKLSSQLGLYNFFLTSVCQPISCCLGGACCLVSAIGTGVLFLISARSCLFSFWFYTDLNPTFIILLSPAKLAGTSAINLHWVWLHIHLSTIFNPCLTYSSILKQQH